MLSRDISGKSFIADRRINERRGVRDNTGETKGAGGATLLVRIRFGGVALAIVAGRFHFHLRTAIGLLDLGNQRLTWQSGESERRRKRQAEQESECPSHDLDLITRLSGAREIRKMPDVMPARGAPHPSSKLFAGDLSGRFNPCPMVEPVMRGAKFC